MKTIISIFATTLLAVSFSVVIHTPAHATTVVIAPPDPDPPPPVSLPDPPTTFDPTAYQSRTSTYTYTAPVNTGSPNTNSSFSRGATPMGNNHSNIEDVIVTTNMNNTMRTTEVGGTTITGVNEFMVKNVSDGSMQPADTPYAGDRTISPTDAPNAGNRSVYTQDTSTTTEVIDGFNY